MSKVTRVVTMTFEGPDAEEVASSDRIMEGVLAYMEDCAHDWFEDWEVEFSSHVCKGACHAPHRIYIHRDTGVVVTFGQSPA